MFSTEHWEAILKEKAEQGNLRTIRDLKPKGALVEIENHTFVSFASNDYLGLALHSEIAAAQAKTAMEWGSGSTGSRLLSGSLGVFLKAEEALAKWKGAESALFFNSGYTANLSLVSTLCDNSTHLFLDRLDHASIYDGVKFSGAQLHRFRHNDPEDLRKHLSKYPGKGWIFTESVFSMDGDLAPLKEYAQLADEFQVGLIVDEAHGDGVFGPGGRGLVHELGLESKVDIVMGTMGKALGCAGACIWAKPIILQWLINQARPFIYSTAQAPAVAGGIIRALELLHEEPWRQTKVQTLARYLREQLQQNGFDILKSQSQIVPVIVGESRNALAASDFLKQHGFWVAPIRPPTVPEGSARLRINVTAAHSQEQIDDLIQALCKWKKEGNP